MIIFHLGKIEYHEDLLIMDGDLMSDSLTTEEMDQLVEAARQAVGKAYAPYSGFAVGAAALARDGRIFTGCNVENVSYGLTICAERTALVKAVSEGSQDIRAVAIYADTEQYCSPCGACRQVIAEFGSNITVIQANKHGKYLANSIEELLPGGFHAGMLGKGTI
ncbi:MAG: cytidine deaminase [Thermincola sp.]|nr:cytidine deaminase [Thermincola sp.]